MIALLPKAGLAGLAKHSLAIRARRGARRGARRSARRGARRSAEQSARRSAERSARRGAERGAERGARRSAERGAGRSAERGARRSAERGAGRGAGGGSGRGGASLEGRTAFCHIPLQQRRSMVLETPYREAKKLKRIFQPRSERAVEMNMIGHDHAPEKPKPAIKPRHGFKRPGDHLAKRRKPHPAAGYFAEKPPSRLGRYSDEKRSAFRIIPAGEPAIAQDRRGHCAKDSPC